MLTKDLLEKRAALVAEAEGLLTASEAEDRDLTADEESRYDAIAGELKSLDARIDRANALESRKAQLVAPATTAAARSIAPASTLSVEAAAGPQPKLEFESIGEYMATMAHNPNDQRLASLWAATTQSTTDARGGYAIPPKFLDQFMAVTAQNEIIRPRATVLPVGANPDQTVQIPALDQSDHGESPTVPKVFGGVSVSWINEGAEKPQTDFKVREIQLTPYEVAASLDVTDRLLANWSSAGAVIESLLSGAMAATHDSAFLNGNGSSKPTGIANSACAATISVNRTTANSFTYADCVNMVSRSMLRDGQEPVWILNPGVRSRLLRMVDDEGNLIWQPNAREGFPSTLLGYQIVWNVRSPILGQSGDVVLADLSKYVIQPGSGPFIGASPHVRWRENITVYKCFWNVDGKAWLTQPFMDEDGQQYSPFVKLN